MTSNPCVNGTADEIRKALTPLIPPSQRPHVPRAAQPCGIGDHWLQAAAATSVVGRLRLRFLRRI